MKKFLWAQTLLIAALSCQTGWATDVYECKSAGKTIYQSRPCLNSGQTVGSAMAAQNGGKPVTASSIVQASSRSSSKTMSFSECKRGSLGLQFLGSSNGKVKSTVVTDSTEAYVVKFCAEDGGGMLTCSAKDNRATFTRFKNCP